MGLGRSWCLGMVVVVVVLADGAGILWLPPCRTAPKKAPAGRWWGWWTHHGGAAVGCCAAAGLTQLWWVSGFAAE